MLKTRELIVENKRTKASQVIVTRASKSFTLWENTLFIIDELQRNEKNLCVASRDYILDCLRVAVEQPNLHRQTFYYNYKLLFTKEYLEKVGERGSIRTTQKGLKHILKLGGNAEEGVQYTKFETYNFLDVPWWVELNGFQEKFFRQILGESKLDSEEVEKEMYREYILTRQEWEASNRTIYGLASFKAQFIRDYIWDKFQIDLTGVYKGKSYYDFGFDNKYESKQVKEKEKFTDRDYFWKNVTTENILIIQSIFTNCSDDLTRMIYEVELYFEQKNIFLQNEKERRNYIMSLCNKYIYTLYGLNVYFKNIKDKSHMIEDFNERLNQVTPIKKNEVVKNIRNLKY